jgi:hypothetical protein
MTIYAPISGRVLTLDAQPGKRLVGMEPASEQNSSTVISMYDPKSLQVRVDVRLEDVPHVQIGQPVEIQSAALARPIAGEVQWVTTRADIQKNTLQVKVSIADPPQVITPEMLAQVTFLAPPQPEVTAVANEPPLRLLVPRPLVADAGSGTSVWVADTAAGIARQQIVQLGRSGTGYGHVDGAVLRAGVDGRLERLRAPSGRIRRRPRLPRRVSHRHRAQHQRHAGEPPPAG